MKPAFSKLLLVSVSVGFVVSAALPLHAAETNTVVEAKVSGHHAQVDITKWDSNNNGHLDGNELKAYQQAMHQQRIQQIQAQRQAEAALRQQQLARQGIPRLIPKAVLLRYDLNKNGIMDPDEWAQYRADQAAKHGLPYTPGNTHGPDARIVSIPAKPIGK